MLQLYNSGELGTSCPSLSLFLSLSVSLCSCFVSTTTWDLPLPPLFQMDDLIHSQSPSDLLTHSLDFDQFRCTNTYTQMIAHVRSCLTDFLIARWLLYGVVLHG